ncbi:MAG: nucleotide exchange factor GrpE [Flavobacteriaceae bacterium]|nr:MAG: nucleotide exchange factor GrpE [Flavobacteriaceae bacterium]
MSQAEQNINPENLEETLDPNAQTSQEIESQNEPETQPSPEELIQIEKDKYLRLFAEFENYKKRTTKERLDLFKTANQEMILAMIPLLDDFERGMGEIQKSQDTELVKGVELIQNKLVGILDSKGLKKQEVKSGDPFDADKHEAITQIPAPTEDLKDKIIDIIETGYTLNDKIIRYAKVVVGK